MTCLHCGDEILGSGKKYCSLLCANRANVRRGKKKHTKICFNDLCKLEFLTEESRQKFCSRSCSATHANLSRSTKKNYKCGNEYCDKTICKNRFCSTECRHKVEEKQYLAGNLDGNTKYSISTYARRFTLSRAENQCEGIDERFNARCSETRVLQIDHIDGNWRNSGPDNLRALCPTCHALTPTFGAKNLGNGRAWKSDYSQYKLKNIPV